LKEAIPCSPELQVWALVIEVEFLDNAPDYATLVDDNNRYPAKLIGFYRLLSREVDEEQSEFQVLTHCVAFQRLDSEIYKKGHFWCVPGCMNEVRTAPKTGVPHSRLS
jgi:hypothetical protein